MMKSCIRRSLIGLGVCSSLVVMGVMSVAQATPPVDDTFQLKAAVKEWCEGNNKYFENVKITVGDKVTVTLSQSGTDISVKVNNTGSADFDAITLTGLAFPSNKAESKLEFAAHGVNPGNDDHFITVRGQATVDTKNKPHVKSMTGTIVYEIIGTYTVDKKTGAQSAPTECFASGTFGTGAKQ